MLRDYRDWLKSELQLLGNASHHAYSFGQANMAKRAIEELDTELARTFVIEIDAAQARRALTELALLEQRETGLTPGLLELRTALQTAFSHAQAARDAAASGEAALGEASGTGSARLPREPEPPEP